MDVEILMILLFWEHTFTAAAAANLIAKPTTHSNPRLPRFRRHRHRRRRRRRHRRRRHYCRSHRRRHHIYRLR